MLEVGCSVGLLTKWLGFFNQHYIILFLVYLVCVLSVGIFRAVYIYIFLDFLAIIRCAVPN